MRLPRSHTQEALVPESVPGASESTPCTRQNPTLHLALKTVDSLEKFSKLGRALSTLVRADPVDPLATRCPSSCHPAPDGYENFENWHRRRRQLRSASGIPVTRPKIGRVTGIVEK
jgi:hypothetical protein